jgi:AcrR family transcriptional regulator
MTRQTSDLPPEPRRRKNMRAEERERAIVSEAVRFFAEVGFEGQTRELAKRMGISHAVIYRHFESKDALIERVYDHIYLRRWNPDWEPLVLDRSRTLEARLTQFYREYAARVFDYDWVRIFVSSGLKSYDLTGRYLSIIREKIIKPAVMELRFELGTSSTSEAPGDNELELFWALHGSIFYIAIRKYVYNVSVEIDVNTVVENTVRSFFNGVRAEFGKV